ncbi:WD repeat-containing protein slp1, partial [Spiromyces aspiralis]
MPDNSGRSDIAGCCLSSGISRNKSAPSFSVTLPKDILAAAGITQAPPPLPLLSSSNLPSSLLAGISTAKMAISVSQPATPTSSRRAADLTTPGSHQRVLRRTPSYNYDRFIPTRTADLMAEYYTIDRAREHSALNSPTKLHFRATGANSRYDAQKEDANRTYEALLRSELLKDEATVAVELKSMDMLPSMNGSDDNPLGTPTITTANTGKSNNNGESRTPQTLRRTKSSLFQFRTPTSESRRKKISILSPYNNSNSNNGNNIVNSEPVALSTPSAVQTMTMISPTATRFGGNNKSSSSSNPGNSGLNQVSLKLLTPKKSRWQIPTTASMVLDAPEIINDFYLNVLDWSPTTNQLAVALFDTVYLWDPETRLTRKLCSVASGNWVTSIQWMRRPNLGDMLAVGTKAGHIDLWDLHSGQLVRTLNGCHRKRVTSLSWFDSVISSGSRDKTICHQDTRIGGRRTSAVVATYHGHTQEVCGLAWNPDINLLASGSNDNLVKIWDRRFHVGGGRRGQRRRTVSQPDLLHGGDNG